MTTSRFACAEVWDAVVIGAGPAGSLAALRLADRGYQVLLVEAKKFPREKVCGGCLNQRAWQILGRHGLVDDLQAAGAIRLNRLALTCGERKANWPMPEMHAISRGTMDSQLASAAGSRGVTLFEETQARLVTESRDEDHVTVELRNRDGKQLEVQARVAIAADGLMHSSLVNLEQAASRVAAGSRIGVGAQIACSGAAYPAGQLTMIVGDAGYVGITRIEGERLNLAAALSVESLQAGAKPSEVVADLIERGREELPEGLSQAHWQGTPALTRESRRWSWHRVFLIGDASGYVEPFTGEGMSWALASAEAVTDFAEKAMDDWHDALAVRWHNQWRRHVQRQQRTCRALAWTLKRPRLASWVLRAAQAAPWLVQPVMRQVSTAQHARF